MTATIADGTVSSASQHWRLSKSTAPLLAGFLGGLVSTTMLLPIDVVKVRLQVDESIYRKTNGGSNASSSISSSLTHLTPKKLRFFRVMGGIVKYEGIGGLYQGWTAAVLGSSISWGGYFYIYENLKHVLIQYRNHAESQSHVSRVSTALPSPRPTLSSMDNFLLAVVSGSCMVAITNPLWLVKTRMQLQMKRASEQLLVARPYRSTLDAFQTIVREEGMLALYKGVGPALLLTSHGGVQFVVYEFLKSRFHIQRPTSEEQQEWSIGHRFTRSLKVLSMGAVAKM
jgi:solute carrier family 25 (mitochondrial folate transporter), member 32